MKARIVIIEGDADTALVLSETLRRADHELEVVAVPSSFTGIDRIAGGPVDCVLVDYGAPDSDGNECLRRVREQWPDVPVIVITGAISECIRIPAETTTRAGIEQRKCLARLVDAVHETIAFSRVRDRRPGSDPDKLQQF